MSVRGDGPGCRPSRRLFGGTCLSVSGRTVVVWTCVDSGRTVGQTHQGKGTFMVTSLRTVVTRVRTRLSTRSLLRRKDLSNGVSGCWSDREDRSRFDVTTVVFADVGSRDSVIYSDYS